MKYPEINPIRFHHVNKEPDWISYMPTIDNQDINKTYYENLKHVPYIKEVDKSFIIQYYFTEEINPTLTLYKVDASGGAYSVITGYPTSITNLYKFTITNLDDGIYFASMTSSYDVLKINVSSDLFIVKSDLTEFVRIKATNTINDYDVVFQTESTPNIFTSIFIGSIDVSEGKTSINQWTSDRGKIVNTRTEVNKYRQVDLFGLHKNYMEHVKVLLACDTLTINDLPVSLVEAPKFTEKEGTQLCNCTFQVQISNENYSYNL